MAGKTSKKSTKVAKKPRQAGRCEGRQAPVARQGETRRDQTQGGDRQRRAIRRKQEQGSLGGRLGRA